MDKEPNITRRTFLKKAGTAIGGLAAASMLSPDKTAAREQNQDKAPDTVTSMEAYKEQISPLLTKQIEALNFDGKEPYAISAFPPVMNMIMHTKKGAVALLQLERVRQAIKNIPQTPTSVATFEEIREIAARPLQDVLADPSKHLWNFAGPAETIEKEVQALEHLGDPHAQTLKDIAPAIKQIAKEWLEKSIATERQREADNARLTVDLQKKYDALSFAQFMAERESGAPILRGLFKELKKRGITEIQEFLASL